MFSFLLQKCLSHHVWNPKCSAKISWRFLFIFLGFGFVLYVVVVVIIIIILSLKLWLNGQEKSKEWGTFLDQLFQRSCLMNQNKSPLKQSAVEVYVDFRQSLSPRSKQIFTNSWPTCGWVNSASYTSLLSYPPMLITAFQTYPWREVTFYERKKRDEKEKKCLYSVWASWLFKPFLQMHFILQAPLLQYIYNCPLTWFYQSYSKDAHHLGLQECYALLPSLCAFP